MMLTTAFVFILTLFGKIRKGNAWKTGGPSLWPGCVAKSERINHRDWFEWYKRQKTSAPDIKVHVYRDPPFNWLHPVSCKRTLKLLSKCCSECIPFV